MPDAKEEAVMLLEAWRAFEAEAESQSESARSACVEAVEKRMPKRVKRKVRCANILRMRNCDVQPSCCSERKKCSFVGRLLHRVLQLMSDRWVCGCSEACRGGRWRRSWYGGVL
jgi:hypothetical protein